MSKYEFTKPYIYKDSYIFPNAIFSDIIFNDCGSSVTGTCEKTKNIDDCLNICNKSGKCSFGYYIETPDNENICVPFDERYHEKSIGPYYKLRNKNIYPILQNMKTSVFSNLKNVFPPVFPNVIFYTDTLSLKKLNSKKFLGITENNTIISNNLLTSYPLYIQFLPKKIVKSLSLKYVPVKNGDEIIINIPKSSYVLKERENDILWIMRQSNLETSDNTFNIFADKKNIGDLLDYNDIVYFKKNNKYITYENQKNNLIIDDINQNIYFEIEPYINVYYCENKKCKTTGLNNTKRDGYNATYKGYNVSRNPVCWNLCENRNKKSSNKIFIIILTIIVIFLFILNLLFNLFVF